MSSGDSVFSSFFFRIYETSKRWNQTMNRNSIASYEDLKDEVEMFNYPRHPSTSPKFGAPQNIHSKLRLSDEW